MNQQDSSNTTPLTGTPLTGTKVLICLLAFFFVVFGANITMSWFALSTFSGVETRDAYSKGRDYNKEIARAKAEQDLGWVIKVETSSPGPGETFLTLTITDKEGSALEALDVSGLLVRVVHEGSDQAITFAPLGQGRYVAAAQLPLPGRWQLRAMVKDASGGTRNIIHDLMVS
jgi:nitrogen fixation protein FixH